MSSAGAHPVVIRAATAADIDTIVALERTSFTNSDERFEARRVRYLVVRPRFTVLVAEGKARVIGWAAGFVHLSGKTPWGRVYAIAVDPHARGQKLGKRLMEGMIEALTSRGAKQIFLEVRSDNHAAGALYRKLGFAECRSLPNYYGHGVAGTRMVRVMEPWPSASS